MKRATGDSDVYSHSIFLHRVRLLEFSLHVLVLTRKQLVMVRERIFAFPLLAAATTGLEEQEALSAFPHLVRANYSYYLEVIIHGVV